MEQQSIIDRPGAAHAGQIATHDAGATAEPSLPRTLTAYPDLARLWEFWHARAGTRPMPTRQDLDTIALKPWLGHLLLIDVLASGRFLYRVYGTCVAHLFEHDFQNREIADLPPDDQWDALEHCEFVVQYRMPHFVERECTFRTLEDFTIQRGRVGVLSLPLSADERNVSQILAAVYPRQE